MTKIYQNYYTKNQYITSYMVSRLNLTEEDYVFEPCGGDGAFIDELVLCSKNIKIDSCDLDPNAVSILKAKYSEEKNINIWEANTLFDKKLDDIASFGGLYTKIIGNPPYGAWFDYNTRDLLKKKYAGFYTKESYAVFLIRCLDLLKPNGKICFILPDTFLYLNLHEQLRRKILNETIIEEITIFPSKLFPGVSFQYSNMCIISLKKVQEPFIDSKIKVISGLKKSEDFIFLSRNKYDADNIKCVYFDQKNFLNNLNYSFIFDSNVSKIMQDHTLNLGDLADCVTGIYCGDNRRFIYTLSKDVKGSRQYNVVPVNKICSHDKISIDGLAENNHYVGIVKGNPKNKYYREVNDWFIDWSDTAVKFYKTNKKSRFQNSEYYFKEGIAIPMVKGSVIKATYMTNMVFDQSIVGIFVKNNNLLYYILGFLNSDTGNKIIHEINPTANNSANYLKKIPIIINEEKVLIITDLVKSILNNHDLLDKNSLLISSIFREIYGF